MATAFKDHFSSHSAGYAAYRPSYPEALVDYLADTAPATELALDCGCGSGQLSRLLARRFERVVATDASAQQIANAGPHERIEYRQAPAEASGLAEASVDLVTVAQAAHWFDLDAFYAEARRVARARSVLALITYGIVECDGAPGAVVAHFYHEVISGYWPPERGHVETGYRSLAFPFDELEAPAMAMRADWALAELIGYVDTWSAVRNAENALGRAPVQRFAAALAKAWGAPETRRQIRWPLSLRVGRLQD